MTAETARRSKLPELVAYHVLRNVNRNKFVTVMNRNGMAHEIGTYH